MEQKYGLFSEREKMWQTKLLPWHLLNSVNLDIFSEKCKPQQSIETKIPANRFWRAEELRGVKQVPSAPRPRKQRGPGPRSNLEARMQSATFSLVKINTKLNFHRQALRLDDRSRRHNTAQRRANKTDESLHF